tara:strand:- start:14107 stop:14703 length:597 start_codon:yes stop_codon:yes gene_type:complete
MVFFLGKDVEIKISTESNRGVAITPAGGASSQIAAITASPAGTFNVKAVGNEDAAFNQLTAAEVSIGAMDEDISYFGMRSQTKAEIKKETTLTLTRKKTDEFMDVLFNEVRYGALSGSSAADDGLAQPTTDRGYRLFIVNNVNSGTAEVITLKGCCIQSHTVTMNTDGTQEETIEFMTYVLPSFGTNGDDGAIDPTEL